MPHQPSRRPPRESERPRSGVVTRRQDVWAAESHTALSGRAAANAAPWRNASGSTLAGVEAAGTLVGRRDPKTASACPENAVVSSADADANADRPGATRTPALIGGALGVPINAGIHTAAFEVNADPGAAPVCPRRCFAGVVIVR